MEHSEYCGNELELFASAINWKRYLTRHIQPFLGDRVLEVGAGIGSNTRYLCSQNQRSWLCLEPDRRMAETLQLEITRGHLPSRCTVRPGVLQDLTPEPEFDTVLYIDVLEHIRDDAAEMRLAKEFLRPGGRLIVLVPAYQSLYSLFDKAIGHYRRYDRTALLNVSPSEMRVLSVKYLDCVGVAASFTNRLVLRQSLPTQQQILFWDRCLIPASRLVDPIVRYSFGKSLLAIWQR